MLCQALFQQKPCNINYRICFQGESLKAMLAKLRFQNAGGRSNVVESFFTNELASCTVIQCFIQVSFLSFAVFFYHRFIQVQLAEKTSERSFKLYATWAVAITILLTNVTKKAF